MTGKKHSTRLLMTLVVSLMALSLVSFAALSVVSAESDTVYQYELDEDLGDLSLDQGDTYSLDLDNVSDFELDGSNDTVLLSQTETGEYEDDENVTWSDSGDSVEFTVAEDSDFAEDLDGGQYTTSDENVTGNVSVGSAGIAMPDVDEDTLTEAGAAFLIGAIGFLLALALVAMRWSN